MARARVFVSSTFYDLKHLRSSLENFVESLGFEAILSEKGTIAYTPDLPLDESCYREAGTADIFVLIVGGRYGSEASASKTPLPKAFYDRYNSITRGEYRAALAREIPLYILIERPVYAEYETFLRNKSNQNIAYAHVDSVNVFELIEDILSQPRNNPLQQFDRYGEIEAWLREQWSGLFRELLQRRQNQQQLASLQAEVAQLADLNRTLKTYLETIVDKVAPATSKDLIASETKRLQDAGLQRTVMSSDLAEHLESRGLRPDALYAALLSTSIREFVRRLGAGPSGRLRRRVGEILSADSGLRMHFITDVNRMRQILDLPEFPEVTAEELDSIAADALKPPPPPKRSRTVNRRRAKGNEGAA